MPITDNGDYVNAWDRLTNDPVTVTTATYNPVYTIDTSSTTSGWGNIPIPTTSSSTFTFNINPDILRNVTFQEHDTPRDYNRIKWPDWSPYNGECEYINDVDNEDEDIEADESLLNFIDSFGEN